VSWRQTSTGEKQAVVGVLPTNLHHTLMFPGWHGELWVQPERAPTQALAYTERLRNKPDGELCAVLGAGAWVLRPLCASLSLEVWRVTRPPAEPPTGNQVGVVATDLAHKVLVESCVVACKMNPVNEYQGPLLEYIFAPLVRARHPLLVRRQCASRRGEGKSECSTLAFISVCGPLAGGCGRSAVRVRWRRGAWHHSHHST
jgi:hypothetical protein